MTRSGDGRPLRETDDLRSKKYVHDQQLAAAEETLAHWCGGRRWVVLCAQMQSGKTGVMRHVGWLLNRSPAAFALRGALALQREDDVIHLMQHISDTTLLGQTKDAMAGAIDESRIFHSPAAERHHRAALVAAGADKVLMLDESHWGTDAGGRIAKFMAAVGAPLTADPRAMAATGGYVLSVSATPFSELGKGAAVGRAFVKMQPGPAYHSLRSMIDAGLLSDNSSGLFEGFPNDPDKGEEALKADAITAWADATLEPARAAKAAADGVARARRDKLFVFVRVAGSGKGAEAAANWRETFVRLLEETGCVATACCFHRLSSRINMASPSGQSA